VSVVVGRRVISTSIRRCLSDVAKARIRLRYDLLKKAPEA
jgi:hypothetical protein